MQIGGASPACRSVQPGSVCPQLEEGEGRSEARRHRCVLQQRHPGTNPSIAAKAQSLDEGLPEISCGHPKAKLLPATNVPAAKDGWSLAD
jgi:hypothetical protein